MYVKIKVVSGARAEKIEKKSEDEYALWVKAPSINNAANTRVLEILREIYPNQSIRIVSGHHSPSKIVSIG